MLEHSKRLPWPVASIAGMASVVLLHGIRTTATMWRTQSAALTATGTPHLAVDLPGHGTRAGEPFTLAASRRVIADAVASLPAPHVVVGLSLGSYVALDWASTTQRPPAAMLLASCGVRPRGAGLAGYIAAARLIGRLPDRGVALHTFMAHRVIADPTMSSDVLAGGVAVDAMVPTLRALRGLDLLAAVRRIDCPLWFVTGVWDHLRLEQRRILAAARAGTLVVVPRAGHLVPLDAPTVFAALVREVVQQADAGTLSRPAQEGTTP